MPPASGMIGLARHAHVVSFMVRRKKRRLTQLLGLTKKVYHTITPYFPSAFLFTLLSNRLGEGSRQAFGTTESPLQTVPCYAVRTDLIYPSFAGPRLDICSNTWLANCQEKHDRHYGGYTTPGGVYIDLDFLPLESFNPLHLFRFAGCLIFGIYPSCWTLPVSSYAAPLAWGIAKPTDQLFYRNL